MQLIQNGTQAGTSPAAPAAASGTPGYANNLPPGIGVTPTILDPDMGNAIIGELASAVTGLGLTLAPGTFTQLLQAMRRVAAANLTAISANTTLTPDNAGVVLVNAASSALTVTLPASSGMNGLPMRLTFLRTDTSSNAVTIAPHAGDAFYPGVSAYTFNLPGAAELSLIGDGTGRWLTPGGRRAHGECRLSVATATSLLLSPYNGQNVLIGGFQYQLPSGGVSISNAGLAASTVYYVYLWNDIGTLALELSTTGHATDALTGVEIKSGDATRTLVGMVSTNASTQFVDTPQQRFCLNWFHRATKYLTSSVSTPDSVTASATPVELSASARVQFLAWPDEAVHMETRGTASNATAGDGAGTYAGLDGTPYSGAVTSIGISFNAGAQVGVSSVGFANTSEGVHTLSPFGQIENGGTATFAVWALGHTRG